MSSSSLDSMFDFLEPVNIAQLTNDEGFKDTQLGTHIAVYDQIFPDLEKADIVLVGCGEMRGAGIEYTNTNAPNAIRLAFYNLYHWHTAVSVADIGNVKCGATLQDSYAVLRMVINELTAIGKKVVILGGSHDVTMAQYQSYVHENKIIDAVCVDARIDMDMESVLPADNFLVELFTGMPNHLKHYNHIGFQSYFMHPQMLETIDKFRFDCYRLGKVKEDISEMEPAIRNSHLFSFDIAAIQHAHAPANHLSPNGFNGEEACTLTQYAGMSHTCNTIGIYGYMPEQDVHQMTAKQIAHMLWYIMDGVNRGKMEASLANRSAFNEFTMAFAEIQTVFLQSKRTGRWWMQLHDGEFVACSLKDYIHAGKNEIPERWMRAVERL